MLGYTLNPRSFSVGSIDGSAAKTTQSGNEKELIGFIDLSAIGDSVKYLDWLNRELLGSP